MEHKAVGAVAGLGCEAVACGAVELQLGASEAVLKCDLAVGLIAEADGVGAIGAEVQTEQSLAIVERTLVDGVACGAVDGEDLRHGRLGAGKLGGIAAEVVLHGGSLVDDYAGAVGLLSVLGQCDVEHGALCGSVDVAVVGSPDALRCAGRFFLHKCAGVAVGLASVLEEGDAFLVDGALHEEGLGGCENVAVVYRAVSLVVLVVAVPHHEGCPEVEEAGVEVAWVGIANEVPAAVVLKLSEVLLKRHGAVVGIEYLLTVDGGGEGAHGELGGIVVIVSIVGLVALHDVALASL